jgi:hypothetical protein
MAPLGGSRDRLRREALEVSLEEDEEEDEALADGPHCAVAPLRPQASPVEYRPTPLRPQTGGESQSVRGPPRAV